MHHSTITKLIYAAALLIGSVPVFTGAMDLEPEQQSAIQSISWLTAAAISGGGRLREESTNVRKERMLDDGLTNSGYMLQRQENMAQHDLESLRRDAVARLQATQLTAKLGVMGLDYVPQPSQQFTTPAVLGQFAQAQAAIAGATSVPGGVSPASSNILNAVANGSVVMSASTMSIGGSTESVEFSEAYMREAYRNCLSKKIRASLNLLVYGNTGDNKTSMMHGMLHYLLQEEPDAIFMISDRKNASLGEPGKEQWASNWFGLPVYPDGKDHKQIKKIRERTDVSMEQKLALIRDLPVQNSIEVLSQSQVPFPHVYASANPRLDLWFQWVYDYCMKWRLSAPMNVYGEFVERTVEERAKDPLWSKEYNRPRPIYIVCDDGLSVMNDMKDGSHKKTANELLTSIGTLFRSEGITVIWVSHSNTQSDNGLTGPLMDTMAVVQGHAACINTTRQSYNRSDVCQDGIDRAKKDIGKVAKGFATSFPNYPYLPSIPLEESQGFLSFIIPELAIQWAQNIPLPHAPKPFHHEIYANYGFEYVPGHGVVRIGTCKPETVPGDKEPEAEYAPSSAYTSDIFVQIRKKIGGNQFDDAELIAVLREFGINPDPAHIPKIRDVIEVTDEEFSSMLSKN